MVSCRQLRDGWRVWALNDVLVSQEIVETPADGLDAALVVAESNAEVRREIVRKIGIERVCHALGAEVVDNRGDYELLELDLQDDLRRPYLKMLNPSTGDWHLEGVAPHIRGVEEALAWRNGTKVKPLLIT